MFHLNLNKKDLGLTFLSAVFLFLSFPRFEYTGLIWFTFVPLLFALRNKTPKQAFWIGFIAGFIFSLSGMYWVIHTLQEFGQLPLILAIPLFLIFSLFCNIHFALFTYLLARFPVSIPPIFWIPVLFTVIEFLFPQIFSWYLGACLYKKQWLIQTADITGVHGITFLVVLVNVTIFELLRWIKKETDIFPKYSFTIALVFMLSSTVYSYLRLSHFKEKMETTPKLKAALIQTNIGNLDKRAAKEGRQAAIDHSLATSERLVMEAAKTPNLDLIVLPETAYPLYFIKDRPKNQIKMFQMAANANVPIAFGGYGKTDTYPRKPYNSLFLISPHFQALGQYNKMRLLAFGEYLPGGEWFPKLKEWAPQVSDFAWGQNIIAMPLSKDFKFAPLICLEGIFPSFVRKFVQKGARFIITVTNDSWFGRTACPYQHRMLHVWRTIENRTPMLRVANTGLSSFIDITGKIQSTTGLFKEEILIDEVSIIEERTFYTIFGDIFSYFLILMLILFIVIDVSIKRSSLAQQA